jgi:uncharacterized LabA/DUF88 family protein
MARDVHGQSHVERVALFIDMSNLYFAARQINIRVDYERLREFVARGRSLLRAFAYMGIDLEDSQTHGLVNYLKRYAGYKVITKPLRRFEDGSAKANLDIEMAIDMLTIAEHVDTIVLISGDGDFTRLVETVQFKGVRVEVVGLEGNTATSLIEAADVFTNLADIVGDIQKVERPVYPRRHPSDGRTSEARWVQERSTRNVPFAVPSTSDDGQSQSADR